MKETVTEEKIVEEQREVVICDYCRLFTSEEIDEPFGQILLNPSTMVTGVSSYGHNEIDHLAKRFAEMEDEHRVRELIVNTILEGFDGDADLCPHCQDDLFGDGPASMRRDAER